MIGYTVKGALRYYPDTGVDQLYWKAIPPDNPFPIQSSIITLHVPEPATFTNYGVYGAEAGATFQPGQRERHDRGPGAHCAGQEVEVVAEWQHGIVAGQPRRGSNNWTRSGRRGKRRAIPGAVGAGVQPGLCLGGGC